MVWSGLGLKCFLTYINLKIEYLSDHFKEFMKTVRSCPGNSPIIRFDTPSFTAGTDKGSVPLGV